MNHSVVRVARPEDASSIAKLLEKGNLNATGIEEHIDHFLVVEQAGANRIVGAAGLELRDEKRGLLRSLAIDSTYLEARVAGLELTRILLAFAAKKGLREIYLVTKTPAFFDLFGFETMEAEDAPESIQQSAHFQQIKNEFSTVMVYKIRSIHKN